MPTAFAAMDSSTLRETLMAPDPMPRARALHALEGIEPGRGASAERVALVREAARLIERGIPYYSVDDPHYRAWVGKVVSCWERLHAAA